MKEKIEELVKNRFTREEIMYEMNWSESQFYWYMKKYLPNVNIKKSSRKVNHKYFEILNSGRKAYLLGFLLADGCITSQSKDNELNCFTVAVKREDEQIVKFFKQEICPDATIQQYTNENNYSISKIQWTSKNMVKDLLNYTNSLRRKSFDQDANIFIEKIPDEYFGDFLRGLIDGDGRVTKKFPRVEILFSSFQMAEKIMNKLIELLPLVNAHIIKDEYYSKESDTKRNQPVYRLFINSNKKSEGKKQIFQDLQKVYYLNVFYNFLYYKCDFFLQRKKVRFTEYRANFQNCEKGLKVV